MKAVILAALIPTAAHAQSQAELVAGQPEFTDCLSDASCEDNFLGFLSGSMAEQGYTMQWDPMISSAAVRPGSGLVISGRVDTFPLGPPPTNLSGKEENTAFSPVLPRLALAWLGGDPEGMAWSAGVSGLPPIPVQGASALVLSAAGSASWALGSSSRLGTELGFSYARARAPVTASSEQLEERDSFSNPDNLDPERYEEVCGEEGCVDTFRVADTSALAVLSWQLGDWSPYVKLGLTWVEERLDVQYDGTGWRLSGLQPTLRGGGLWAPTSALRLGAGLSLAPAHGGIYDGGLPLFYNLSGSIGLQL